ncbi:MAG: hypothetical protein AAF416_22625 [Pseudomonadota bacterium]
MSGPGTSTAKTAARPKLDIDRTRERLIAPGCAHAAEQLGDVLDGAVAQGEPSVRHWCEHNGERAAGLSRPPARGGIGRA